MPLYSRRQLLLLVVVLAVAGFGLGVGQWRRSHPDLGMRLEQLDVAGPRNEGDAAGERPALGGGAGRQRGTAHDRPDCTPHDRDLGTRTGAGGAPDARRPAPKVEVGRGPMQPLDLNHATATDLTRLPGVGPVLAERIVAARGARGAFESVDDLRRVRGLGGVKLDRLRALVTVAASLGGAGGDAMVR